MPSFTNFNTLNLVNRFVHKHMDTKQTHGHQKKKWTQNKHMDTKQTHGHILFNMNFNET